MVAASWVSGKLDKLQEWALGMTRFKATALSGLVAWVLGIGTILSFSRWKFSFSFAGLAKDNGLFDIFDIITANFMLPIGGLLIAIFSAWMMSKESSRDELKLKEPWFSAWRVTTRYVSPAGVGLIFLHAVGIL